MIPVDQEERFFCHLASCRDTDTTTFSFVLYFAARISPWLTCYVILNNETFPDPSPPIILLDSYKRSNPLSCFSERTLVFSNE